MAERCLLVCVMSPALKAVGPYPLWSKYKIYNYQSKHSDVCEILLHFFIGTGINLFVSSNTCGENFILTSTAQLNIYPQNHNTYDKPFIKGKLVLQLKKLQRIANFLMQIHNNELIKVIGTVSNMILNGTEHYNR